MLVTTTAWKVCTKVSVSSSLSKTGPAVAPPGRSLFRAETRCGGSGLPPQPLRRQTGRKSPGGRRETGTSDVRLPCAAAGPLETWPTPPRATPRYIPSESHNVAVPHRCQATRASANHASSATYVRHPVRTNRPRSVDADRLPPRTDVGKTGAGHPPFCDPESREPPCR